ENFLPDPGNGLLDLALGLDICGPQRRPLMGGLNSLSLIQELELYPLVYSRLQIRGRNQRLPGQIPIQDVFQNARSLFLRDREICDGRSERRVALIIEGLLFLLGKAPYFPIDTEPGENTLLIAPPGERVHEEIGRGIGRVTDSSE